MNLVVRVAAIAADGLLNLIDSDAKRRARAGRCTPQSSSPRPPGGGDSPADPPPHQGPPGALPTSALLDRSADVLVVLASAVDIFGALSVDAGRDIDAWTHELRDRAAQFAAHGD